MPTICGLPMDSTRASTCAWFSLNPLGLKFKSLKVDSTDISAELPLISGPPPFGGSAATLWGKLPRPSGTLALRSGPSPFGAAADTSVGKMSHEEKTTRLLFLPAQKGVPTAPRITSGSLKTSSTSSAGRASAPRPGQNPGFSHTPGHSARHGRAERAHTDNH